MANLERGSTWQSQTDSFLHATNVAVCGNDYTATLVNSVRNLFAPPTPSNSNPRPVFVAINCISNSPTHAYRQVIVNEIHTGGGATDFSANIAGFRTLIDTVQPAPPPSRLLSPQQLGDGSFQFTLAGRVSRAYRIEATTNSVSWTPVSTNVTGPSGIATVRDTNAPAHPRRSYRAREN